MTNENSDKNLDRVAGPFEAVEDQVEPERELVAVVVAGLQDVFEGQFGEMRVLVGGSSTRIFFASLAVFPLVDGTFLSCRANP